MTVWVLVCDAARAMFFHVSDNETWRLVNVISHPESRSNAVDLNKEAEKERFGHSLVQALDRAVRSSRFDRWVLVAPPHFVGLIKKGLTPELEKRLMTTVDKDMVHLPLHSLVENLQVAVRIPVDHRNAIRETHRQAH